MIICINTYPYTVKMHVLGSECFVKICLWKHLTFSMRSISIFLHTKEKEGNYRLFWFFPKFINAWNLFKCHVNVFIGTALYSMIQLKSIWEFITRSRIRASIESETHITKLMRSEMHWDRIEMQRRWYRKEYITWIQLHKQHIVSQQILHVVLMVFFLGVFLIIYFMDVSIK